MLTVHLLRHKHPSSRKNNRLHTVNILIVLQKFCIRTCSCYKTYQFLESLGDLAESENSLCAYNEWLALVLNDALD